MKEIKVGQACVYQGAPALVREVGDEQTRPNTGEAYRWLTLATHRGVEEVASDHQYLFFP